MRYLQIMVLLGNTKYHYENLLEQKVSHEQNVSHDIEPFWHNNDNSKTWNEKHQNQCYTASVLPHETFQVSRVSVLLQLTIPMDTFATFVDFMFLFLIFQLFLFFFLGILEEDPS